MQSVLSCLVTDVIGPASLAQELVAAACVQFSHEGGRALREYVRAIELTASAMELSPGDRVILSPLAPPAYLQVFSRLGIVPVFPDVNEDDACLNAGLTEAKLNEGNIKAVFVHAPLGRIPSLDFLSDFDVPVAADAGQCLGAVDSSGSPFGKNADFLILPMETDAIVTAGGGTLVLAGNRSALGSLEEKSRELSSDAFLPDLNASLGLVQWREFPEALETRQMIADIFKEALRKGRHCTLANPGSEECMSVPYSFPVVLSSGMKEVRTYAMKKGIETSAAFNLAAEECPAARSLALSVLLFPLYPTLGKKNVQHISKVLSTLP